MLTDGEIMDLENQCALLFPKFKNQLTEVYAFGFGEDWKDEPLKSLLRDNCRGGEFKPISTNPTVSNFDIKNTLARFAQARGTILASQVDLEVSFTPDVSPGDVFSYHPIARYFGSKVFSGNTYIAGVPSLQEGKEYSWCFETRLQKSSVTQHKIGNIVLRYHHNGQHVEQHKAIIVRRHPDPYQCQAIRNDMQDIFTFLEILRSDDPLKQRRALEIRRDNELRKPSYDPKYVEALDNAIEALKAGKSLAELPHEVQIWVRTDPRGQTQRIFS
jgi:hypothetical protein